MVRRLPDPAWKSGPPDPPRWTVHTHEFEYAEADVEVIDGYVYVYQGCLVDDGNPHDTQRCGAKRHITYQAAQVERLESGNPERSHTITRGRDLWDEAVIHAVQLISEDPFQYDILEQSDFEVDVDLDSGSFIVTFKHDGTEVHEW